jgi:N-acetylmuramoyl-L-alanine amidase
MSASPTNTNLGLNRHLSAVIAPPTIFAHPPGAPGHEALQALLAFSSLHDQIRRQTQSAGQAKSSDASQVEKFALDEVLQLVAERALTLTGASGVAIALAEGDAIICRASAGEIAPDKLAKLNPNSGFSGACFRTGQIVRCDDTENDPRVNVQAARRLGTRSMVAVPLAGRHGTIGLLEAFSNRAYGFKDSNIRSLNLLAELILAALKPEDESASFETLPEVISKVEGVADNRPQEPITQQAVTVMPAPILEAPSEVKTPDADAEIYQQLQSARTQLDTPGGSSPGLKIALVLVILAIVVGAGLWWKLSASQSRISSTSAVSSAPTQISQPTGISPVSTPEPASSSVRADGLTAVTGIRHWSSSDSSTVVIDLQDQVQYEQHRLSDPDRIYFDLHDTSLSHELAGKVVEVGDLLLMRVRVAQPTPGITRVVLDTRNSPAYNVSLKQDPYRLEVQIRSAGVPQPKSNVDLFGPANQPLQSPAVKAQVAVAAPMPAQSIASTVHHAPATVAAQTPKFRIVLDAGHGGWDEGTIGRRGLMEKDLALDVVARLGKLVTERLGAEVVYTRRDDTYIPLEKRAEIANLSQADFFVSVHANYSDVPSARGVETYFANTYSSLNARIPGTDAPVQNVNWTNVDIREKAQQSQRLAAAVQNALYDKLVTENPGLPNRGVKKASYVVLTGTTMPAILAEVSFVSSPTDEKSLKRAAYRQHIAEALYRGIAHYTSEQRKMTMASASRKPVTR